MLSQKKVKEHLEKFLNLRSQKSQEIFSFLKNGDNKKLPTQLMFEYTTAHKQKCIGISQTSTILLSHDKNVFLFLLIHLQRYQY